MYSLIPRPVLVLHYVPISSIYSSIFSIVQVMSILSGEARLCRYSETVNSKRKVYTPDHHFQTALIWPYQNNQAYECPRLISQYKHFSVDVMKLIQRQMSQRMTKPSKWHVCPAKIQISLGIRSVWSESSLSAWRKFGSLATHWVHSEDSDQTGRMPRLIWVFAGRTCHFVGFVMHWLKYDLL